MQITALETFARRQMVVGADADAIVGADGKWSGVRQTVLERLDAHRREIAALKLGRGEIPDDLRCPLTLEIFLDPVSAADGHTYERVAIEEWLATGARTSPVTNEPLESLKLVPQHTVKKLTAAFIDSHRRC